MSEPKYTVKKSVASVPTWHIMDGGSARASVYGSDAEAKATLFAAAPDLLEALERCLAAIPQGQTAHKWEIEAADAARAAIAKAKGESQ